MLILKFVRTEDEGTVFDTVTCSHYSLYDKNNGLKLITTYDDHTNTKGVERCIGEKLKYISNSTVTYNAGYDACFVMDSSGKTIDTIRKSKEVGYD